MAIVVEEEQSRTDIVRLLGWLTVLCIIGAAVYYIFFAAPELVVIPTPTGFNTITPLAQMTIHPEDVLNSAAFQTLKANGGLG